MPPEGEGAALWLLFLPFRKADALPVVRAGFVNKPVKIRDLLSQDHQIAARLQSVIIRER